MSVNLIRLNNKSIFLVCQTVQVKASTIQPCYQIEINTKINKQLFHGETEFDQ